MLEQIFGKDGKMNIHQCQEIAKRGGYDKMKFDLVGPKGRKSCKWLDAYMGLFTMEGSDGFLMVRDFEFAHDIWCENVMPPESSAAPETSSKEK